MAGTADFKIARHNVIREIILNHLDRRLIEDNDFYFGGGTLCSMKFGEYRESVDIDFLSCSRSGAVQLKLNSASLTDLPLWQNREPKVDKDGVRMWCEYNGVCFKLEFIFESRIKFLRPERFRDILSLDSVSLMACKFLANSDRGYTAFEAPKDITDILAIYGAEPQALRPAWDIAFDAYGSWLQRCTKISLDRDRFDETLETVGVELERRKEFSDLLLKLSEEIKPLLD